MKRVLMIAYHFPPLAGSSGIQRTLRLVQDLPRFGWQAAVLSTDLRAYERISEDPANEIPAGTPVRRAFALDTARHLQLGGRYLGWMARPDRWISWRFDGLRQGLRLAREFKPDLIWSTYPIASAHVIGSALHRRTGLPWVADFRDPMAHDGYPEDPKTWQRFLEVEQDVVRQASRCVFTAPGAAALYRERYPDTADRMRVIENGYDEDSFARLPVTGLAPSAGRPMVMLHSGVVYATERDPTPLFTALGRLRQSGRLGPQDLRIRFRAAVNESMLRDLAQQQGASEFIEICPAIPYRDALTEMVGTDVLLVMQAANCNAQIPAKIYEYLRAGRPIVGLTDPAGDTAGVLREAAVPDIVPLDSAEAIAAALPGLVDRWRAGLLPLPRPEAVKAASRLGRAEAMARLFEEVALSPSR
ncbi:glycosyltransferase [Pelomonas sp. SE-A7]|uniref:glycosyltransferase n=1 Tax=Pelomonas sp. SE-A7 TaxID=3054953 RepID=UPI00259D06DB|nr:glycosyltransferase [Pelomonas sp. SE-A7]MDM4764887.1 glycosyltransferase [Pelomonas sp. SE-A7]